MVNLSQNLVDLFTDFDPIAEPFYIESMRFPRKFQKMPGRMDFAKQGLG